MSVFLDAYTYALERSNELSEALQRHVLLVGIALGIGVVLCVPLGILTARSRTTALVCINGVNALRVIPSIVVLFLALPFFGLTFKSAAIALTILALPPHSHQHRRGLPFYQSGHTRSRARYGHDILAGDAPY